MWYEFWTPLTRAGLVTVDAAEMVGFEIKSDRDNLDLLARQVACYQMVFDRRQVVTGRRHLDAIEKVLPPWWGLTVAGPGGAGDLEEIRSAQANPRPRCAETLVRLLWKADVAPALCRLELITGRELRVMRRDAMWTRLVACIVERRTVDRPCFRRTRRRVIHLGGRPP